MKSFAVLLLVICGMIGCTSVDRTIHIYSITTLQPITGALYLQPNVRMIRMRYSQPSPVKADANGMVTVRGKNIFAEVIYPGFYPTRYRGQGGNVFLSPIPDEKSHFKRGLKRAETLFLQAALHDQDPVAFSYRYPDPGSDPLRIEWNLISKQYLAATVDGN